MIRPAEIRQKAANLYPAFLRAWLGGESFLPRTIPCRKRPDENLATAAASVRRLRDESKEVRGYGYSVEWTEINSRDYGRNLFPTRITFETEADFLECLGKEAEFAAFAIAVDRVRSRYPELRAWIKSHPQTLLDAAGDVQGLLAVIDFFRANPRPNVFARELPLGLDTKFVERNRRILREWLDRVLPPETIRADEEHFERRFGLRYAELDVPVRFLDHRPQRDSGCPWPQLSLPLGSLGELSPGTPQVIIVENKINLLTLPPLHNTLALGGVGNAVVDLRHVPWLHWCSIWYWGDIDAEGLTILSRLRAVFPTARSLMMDGQTLEQWRNLALPGTARTHPMPPGLTDLEQSAFRTCVTDNVRIEQERLPQWFVSERIAALAAQPPD